MKKPLFFLLTFCFLLPFSPKPHACSAVYLNKKGNLILGNNMDWIMGEGMVVVNKRNVVKRGFWYKNIPDWTWTSTYGSITFNFEGPEFPIRGVNEAGLIIIELMLAETKFPPSGDLPVLSGSQWFQYQLDKSATIQDVLASDTVVRIESSDWEGMASHYLICDSTGAIAGIEWINGERIVYTGDSLPIPAMVNSSYPSCITNGDDPSGRFKKIADFYAAYDTVKIDNPVEYMFSMLESAAQFSPPFQTRWAMAYDVKARRYYWKTNLANSVRYVNIRDFDFSCESEDVVLDINVNDSGNVRSRFVPFTIGANRDIVSNSYNLYNQWSSFTGRVYPEDTIEAIIYFPESTYCAGSSACSPAIVKQDDFSLIYDSERSIIRFELPVRLSGEITLSIFDLHGRMIMSSTGSSVHQKQNLRSRRIPRITPGVYYCKITAGNKTFIRSISNPF